MTASHAFAASSAAVKHLGIKALSEADCRRFEKAIALRAARGFSRAGELIEERLRIKAPFASQAFDPAICPVQLDHQSFRQPGQLVQPVDILRDNCVQSAGSCRSKMAR